MDSPSPLLRLFFKGRECRLTYRLLNNMGFVVERKPDRFLIGGAACIGPMRRVRVNRGRPARCPRGRHGQGLHDAPMTAGHPLIMLLPRSVLTTWPLRAAFFARLVS